MIQRMLVIWSLDPLLFLNPEVVYSHTNLKDFEHYLASMGNEHNCTVVWTLYDIAFLWDWDENWPFSVLWPLLCFPSLLAYECSTFTASYFRIWNSSTGVSSPPLALLVVMLPKTLLTSHSRMSGSRWMITPLWFSGSWISFSYSSWPHGL